MRGGDEVLFRDDSAGRTGSAVRFGFAFFCISLRVPTTFRQAHTSCIGEGGSGPLLCVCEYEDARVGGTQSFRLATFLRRVRSPAGPLNRSAARRAIWLLVQRASPFVRASNVRPPPALLLKFYRALVHEVSANGNTCVVKFVDYGNHEEVLCSDVQTVSLAQWDKGQSSSSRQEYHRPAGSGSTASGGGAHGRPQQQLYQPPAQRRQAPT
ncbi:hypothetical protein MRX96_037638 [Rhipicephalus microplus]